MLASWISLTRSPIVIQKGDSNVLMSMPLFLNDNELLIVPYTNSNTNSLLKYNMNEDKWTKWIKYPDDLQSMYHTASLNEDKTMLYIFNECGNIIECNLKTETFKVSKNRYHDGSYSQSLFINGLFNVLGGWHKDHKSHFIWNPKEETFIEKQKLSIIKHPELRSHSIQYIPSKQSILIFPGHTSGTIGNTIYLYSLITNQCDILQIKLKIQIKEKCTVMTSDERHFIIFGRIGDDDDDFSDFSDSDQNHIDSKTIIQILDLEQMIIKKCNIDGPINTSHSLRAVIKNDDYRSDLITFGYIRKCWNLPQFTNITPIPLSLIQLIKSWCYDEIIYLIDTKQTNLWKMQVHHILNNCEI